MGGARVESAQRPSEDENILRPGHACLGVGAQAERRRRSLLEELPSRSGVPTLLPNCSTGRGRFHRAETNAELEGGEAVALRLSCCRFSKSTRWGCYHASRSGGTRASRPLHPQRPPQRRLPRPKGNSRRSTQGNLTSSSMAPCWLTSSRRRSRRSSPPRSGSLISTAAAQCACRLRRAAPCCHRNLGERFPPAMPCVPLSPCSCLVRAVTGKS